MPGTNYVGNAYRTISNLMGTPIPGAESGGFDALSGGYESGVQNGLADLTRRGLTNSGAIPQLYTGLGEQYSQGASQVISQAQSARNQQVQQLLSSLLGLGGPTTQQAEAQIGGQLNTIGNIGGLTAGALTGIVGSAKQPGLLFSGLYGNPGAFLNQILGLP